MSQINQKGFTIVEVLLVIIALVLLVGVGLYGYNSVKKEDKKEDVSSRSESSSEEKNEPKEYYEFPELGVKIILPHELEDITQSSRQVEYTDTIGSGVTSGTLIEVSTKSFDKLCSGINIEFALLGKGQGNYNDAVKKSEGGTFEDYRPGALLKQFDGYFIDIVSGKGNGGYSDCSNQEQALNDASRLQAILEKAFQTAEPL